MSCRRRHCSPDREREPVQTQKSSAETWALHHRNSGSHSSSVLPEPARRVHRWHPDRRRARAWRSLLCWGQHRGATTRYASTGRRPLHSWDAFPLPLNFRPHPVPEPGPGELSRRSLTHGDHVRDADVERVSPHSAIVGDIDCFQRDLQLVAFLEVVAGHDIGDAHLASCLFQIEIGRGVFAGGSKGPDGQGMGIAQCRCNFVGQSQAQKIHALLSAHVLKRKDSDRVGLAELALGASRCFSFQKIAATIATNTAATRTIIFPLIFRGLICPETAAESRLTAACRLELEDLTPALSASSLTMAGVDLRFRCRALGVADRCASRKRAGSARHDLFPMPCR